MLAAPEVAALRTSSSSTPDAFEHYKYIYSEEEESSNNSSSNGTMSVFERLLAEFRARDYESALRIMNMSQEVVALVRAQTAYEADLTDSYPLFPKSADPLTYCIDYSSDAGTGAGLGLGLLGPANASDGAENGSAFGTLSTSAPAQEAAYEGDRLAHIVIYFQTHFVYPVLIFLGVLFNSLALMTLLRKHVRSNLTYFRCARFPLLRPQHSVQCSVSFDL